MAVGTVNGEVEAVELGMAMPNERLFRDLSRDYSEPPAPIRRIFREHDISWGEGPRRAILAG